MAFLNDFRQPDHTFYNQKVKGNHLTLCAC
nr:MAG TPA: hypothetical protein [Caudoviricetes sp.]